MSFWPSQSTVVSYLDMGGFVMLPLIIVSIVLWYALAYRFINIRASKANPRELVRQLEKHGRTDPSITGSAAAIALDKFGKVENPRDLKHVLNEEFSIFKASITQHKKLVRSLVAVAPLLGLLGTVDGMIETFNSLGDMALFSQTGGIAGGISKALFTTQMGLAISIPGLLLGRVIERKERNVRRELDQILDIICARAKSKSI